jgi:hypothetical protein
MTALLVAGCGLVSYGCWLAWHPAGWIVGGLLLTFGSLAYGRTVE